MLEDELGQSGQDFWNQRESAEVSGWASWGIWHPESLMHVMLVKCEK